MGLFSKPVDFDQKAIDELNERRVKADAAAEAAAIQRKREEAAHAGISPDAAALDVSAGELEQGPDAYTKAGEREIDKLNAENKAWEADTDHTNDINLNTGRATREDGTGLPGDQIPPNAETPQNGAESPSASSTPQQPVEENDDWRLNPAIRKTQAEMMEDAKKFSSGKARDKNFIMDMDHGFFTTLDRKVNEALRGNSPEEVAENMFFAALTLAFDMASDALTHHRKKRERIEERYQRAMEESEGKMEGKAAGLYFLMLLSHPDMQQYLDEKPLSEAGKKKALEVSKQPEFMAGWREMYGTLVGHDTPKASTKKAEKTFFKMINKGHSLKTLGEIGAEDEDVTRSVRTSQKIQGPTGLHSRCGQNVVAHKALNEYRAALKDERNRARGRDEISRENAARSQAARRESAYNSAA